MRLRRAYHDISEVTCILDQSRILGLYGADARAISVADNHDKVGSHTCDGVVFEEPNKLLVELRRPTSGIANVDFYSDTLLVCQTPDEGVDEPLVSDVLKEQGDSHLASQVPSFQDVRQGAVGRLLPKHQVVVDPLEPGLPRFFPASYDQDTPFEVGVRIVGALDVVR